MTQNVKHRFERGVNEQNRTDLEKGDRELWELMGPVRQPKEPVVSSIIPEGSQTMSPSEAIADINDNLDRECSMKSSQCASHVNRIT